MTKMVVAMAIMLMVAEMMLVIITVVVMMAMLMLLMMMIMMKVRMKENLVSIHHSPKFYKFKTTDTISAPYQDRCPRDENGCQGLSGTAGH